MTNPSIIMDGVIKLAYYAVIAFGIQSGKTVIIAFINRNVPLNDILGMPRTPEEIEIDQARLN
jgi:hypothetical protein